MLTLTQRYTEALTWICELHSGQRRKMNQDPYVSHLLRVGGQVLEWAEDEDEAIAALLHDAAEDCGGEKTLREIERRFGERTARLVFQCSDSLTESSDAKLPWRERKETHIARAADADPAARRIMLFDKMDNMNGILAQYVTLGDEIFRFFHGGREIGWYFRSMFEVLSADAPIQLAQRAEKLVREIEEICREK